MTLVVADIRFHATSYMQISEKHCRNLAQLGNDYIKRCSPKASDQLKRKVLFQMRNDTITRRVKYDNLIIEYGNDLIHHLRQDHHWGGIPNLCVQLV